MQSVVGYFTGKSQLRRDVENFDATLREYYNRVAAYTAAIEHDSKPTMVHLRSKIASVKQDLATERSKFDQTSIPVDDISDDMTRYITQIIRLFRKVSVLANNILPTLYDESTLSAEEKSLYQSWYRGIGHYSTLVQSLQKQADVLEAHNTRVKAELRERRLAYIRTHPVGTIRRVVTYSKYLLVRIKFAFEWIAFIDALDALRDNRTKTPGGVVGGIFAVVKETMVDAASFSAALEQVLPSVMLAVNVEMRKPLRLQHTGFQTLETFVRANLEKWTAGLTFSNEVKDGVRKVITESMRAAVAINSDPVMYRKLLYDIDSAGYTRDLKDSDSRLNTAIGQLSQTIDAFDAGLIAVFAKHDTIHADYYDRQLNQVPADDHDLDSKITSLKTLYGLMTAVYNDAFGVAMALDAEQYRLIHSYVMTQGPVLNQDFASDHIQVQLNVLLQDGNYAVENYERAIREAFKDKIEAAADTSYVLELTGGNIADCSVCGVRTKLCGNRSGKPLCSKACMRRLA